MTISDKGLRFSADHIRTTQINVYIPRTCFRSFSWSSPPEQTTGKVGIPTRVLFEALMAVGATKTKDTDRSLDITWFSNKDHLALK